MQRKNTLRVRSLSSFAAGLVACGLCGCDVQQTRAGELPDVDFDAGELPDYEIVKTEDGALPDVDVQGGQLPKFDVDWMDVDVGLAETTVQVPKLKLVVEEETITVPKIDVDWPGHEDELVERKLRAEVETETSGYDLEIERVYAGDELTVISRLRPTGDAAASGQPERLTDYIVVKAPDVDVEHYVIGSRPDRDFNDDVNFVDGMSELQDRIENARLIYERK